MGVVASKADKKAKKKAGEEQMRQMLKQSDPDGGKPSKGNVRKKLREAEQTRRALLVNAHLRQKQQVKEAVSAILVENSAPNTPRSGWGTPRASTPRGSSTPRGAFTPPQSALTPTDLSEAVHQRLGAEFGGRPTRYADAQTIRRTMSNLSDKPQIPRSIREDPREGDSGSETQSMIGGEPLRMPASEPPQPKPQAIPLLTGPHVDSMMLSTKTAHLESYLAAEAQLAEAKAAALERKQQAAEMLKYKNPSPLLLTQPEMQTPFEDEEEIVIHQSPLPSPRWRSRQESAFQQPAQSPRWHPQQEEVLQKPPQSPGWRPRQAPELPKPPQSPRWRPQHVHQPPLQTPQWVPQPQNAPADILEVSQHDPDMESTAMDLSSGYYDYSIVPVDVDQGKLLVDAVRPGEASAVEAPELRAMPVNTDIGRNLVVKTQRPEDAELDKEEVSGGIQHVSSSDSSETRRPITPRRGQEGSPLPARHPMRTDSQLSTASTTTSTRESPFASAKVQLEGAFKYTELAHLGRGPALEVKLMENAASGEVVAARFLENDSPQVLSKAMEQAIIDHRNLSHPNIIGFVEVFMGDTALVIVTDHAAGGRLDAKIAGWGRMDELAARSFFYQLVDATAYCHFKGLPHGHLRADSVLLDGSPSRPVAKIVGFGYPMDICAEDGTANKVEQLAYEAPETLLRALQNPGEGSNLAVADCWALGAILYLCLTGTLPFVDESKPEREKKQTLLQNLLFGSYAFPPDLELSSQCRDFLSRVLNPEPGGRLTAEEMLRHPWLADAEPNSMEEVVSSPQTQCAIDIGGVIDRARQRRLVAGR